MNADTLDVLLDDLARACEDAYESVDDAPPMPGDVLKIHGSAVWDQPQIAVSCAGVRPLLVNKCALVPAADLVVEVVRKGWPGAVGMVDGGMAPPATADVHAATALLARDALTLFIHLTRTACADGLFPTIAERGGRILCGDVTFQTMVPLAPSGGYAGWRWPLTVKLAIP